MKILVPLAEGFEEIEAVTILDVLRRAGLDTTSAGLTGNPVRGSHGIPVMADEPLAGLRPGDFGAIVLPGGMPGSDNLKKSDTVISFIQSIYRRGGVTAALCAAPMVLGHAGVLAGKKATCFPGFESEMKGATPTGSPVEVDGTIITARGPGCAIPFALALVEALAGKTMMRDLRDAMQVYWL
ncbi:MAG: DJ-1 family glyoxalase III [Spirochaetota bacterium]|jgi:4-methyl-5(b-hydroxyethyl)-thiazole monophosphate biosynthesis